MAHQGHLPVEGTRIRVLSGHLGTIRYVGEVDGSQGVWLGVEWDDPGRGKHDGIKDSKRYFHCRVSNAGSFIRPSASIYYGHSFLHALTEKYVEPVHPSSTQEKIILGSSNGKIEVEAVSMDKVRNKFARLERLQEASLDSQDVATCDPEGEINRTCPNIRGLDLSANLLGSWDTVATITAELPLLERLALNRNRFTPLRTPLNLAAFARLTELQLNGTFISWEEFTVVIRFMTNLRLAEMGYNRLHHLAIGHSPISVESKVQDLNFDGNELDDWPHICRTLRPYCALQRLVLTANRIQKIPYPQDGSSSLNQLRQLVLTSNHLTDWEDIDCLSIWCPQLEALNISGNPLVQDADFSRHARQLIVAKIPSLLTLDSAAISRKERVDCELFYLSHVLKTVADDDERHRKHRQWRVLCQSEWSADMPRLSAAKRVYGPPAEHGKPAEIAQKTQQDKLSNFLIQLNLFRCRELPCSPTDQEIRDKVVSQTTLRILSTSSLRAFRLKVLKSFKDIKNPAKEAKLQIWLRMHDDTLASLDNDDNDLAWWGIENGSDVFVYVQQK